MSLAKSIRTLFFFFAGMALVSPASAQRYKVLYSFTGGSDGASPEGGLVRDSAGNLYGTTLGRNDFWYPKVTGTTLGSVFKLDAGGQFTLLYNFGVGGANGAYPVGGLIMDPAGNLYGATQGGASTNPSCSGFPQNEYGGCGEIFKVDAAGNFSVFYSFSGEMECWDGCTPLAPLTIDPAGNLYGATLLGGNRDCDPDRINFSDGTLPSLCGVIFKLDATGKETVIHRFGNAARDGDSPNPNLILDETGNLYGTAVGGGLDNKGGNAFGGAGTVFKLDPSLKPTASEAVLHYFELSDDLISPGAGLIRDAAGNLYGVAGNGAFEINSEGGYTVLSSAFPGKSFGPLFRDTAGNLYGTTRNGGNLNCEIDIPYGCGTVLKLDPSGNLTILHKFSGGSDGGIPLAGLIMDSAGNLYGTTAYGGTTNNACPDGCGVVFKIKP